MSTLWLPCTLVVLVLIVPLSLLLARFWWHCRQLHETQHDLYEAKRQIEEDNRQLMSMLSHELRSPMSTISNATAVIDLALAQGDTALVLEMTQNIRQGLSRLTHVVDNLSVEARFAEWETQTPQHISLDKHLRKLLYQIQQPHPERKIALHLHGVTTVTLPAPGMFDILLIHLLDNAIKYSPVTCPIELTVTATAKQPMVIEVADRGPGLEPALRAQLFKKYIRGRQTGNTGGTGLGLFLVKYIVDTLNGTIQVLERDGGGTCFRIELPL